jgi:hypothetical protein
MAKYKGVEINTSPSDGMVDEAERGLDWREEYGRGGTAVGVARARDIINGRDLSINTVKRMYSFFSRHEVDKQAEGFSPGEEGYPSAGRIAWALWGGDPGFSWSKRIVKRLDSLDDRSMLELQNATEEKDMTDQQVDIEEVVEAATEVAEVIETTTEEDRAGTVEVSHRAMEMEARSREADWRNRIS